MNPIAPLTDPLSVPWTARWIEPVEPLHSPSARRPAYYLATEFIVSQPVVSAVLRATAHGIYEGFLNGTRIGDLELTPGFNAYRHRLQVHTFDVTSLIHEGANALGAILSDGWWRGQHGVIREINAYGPTTAFLAELHLTHVFGETSVITTDGSWRSTQSHILAADLIAGEVHDQRARLRGWAEANADRRLWDVVNIADYGYQTLCDPIGPPVRRIETIVPVAITSVRPNDHLVDFGQNSNGWVQLLQLGPTGTVSTLTYGEALDPNGELTQANVADGAFSEPRDLPFQTDVVTSAGDDTYFEPRHSTKGFRYVRVQGPSSIQSTDIVSVVVHSDLKPIGSFRCSDERLNRLHDACVWSFRANACDLPTDCPTRERSGWVGDWQLYVETAAFLYDVTDFSVKWLRDLAADQFANGRVTSIVPDPSPTAPVWGATHGSSGWGDAAVHVPWELYRATGRTDFIAAQLSSMQGWVDFCASRAATKRHPTRVARSADPLPHERFLWDAGWHFGEWLVPGDDMTQLIARLATDDHGIVATAYLFRSARELSQLAQLIGEHSIADHYGELASSVADAWRTEFINENGHVVPTTQADIVRALRFGLLPVDLHPQAIDDLVGLIRKTTDHLGTGFLATPFLLPVLADHGRLDVAYELLFQDTQPSWLAMTEKGATTIWEDWDGVDANGTAKHSLNHYSKGAVISFLHQYVAGLQLQEPGYKHFAVTPYPGAGISNASANHVSPYGEISVTWSIEKTVGSIDVTVPAETTCDLTLPEGQVETLGSGFHQRTWRTA